MTIGHVDDRDPLGPSVQNDILTAEDDANVPALLRLIAFQLIGLRRDIADLKDEIPSCEAHVYSEEQ